MRILADSNDVVSLPPSEQYKYNFIERQLASSSSRGLYVVDIRPSVTGRVARHTVVIDIQWSVKLVAHHRVDGLGVS